MVWEKPESCSRITMSHRMCGPLRSSNGVRPVRHWFRSEVVFFCHATADDGARLLSTQSTACFSPGRFFRMGMACNLAASGLVARPGELSRTLVGARCPSVSERFFVRLERSPRALFWSGLLPHVSRERTFWVRHATAVTPRVGMCFADRAGTVPRPNHSPARPLTGSAAAATRALTRATRVTRMHNLLIWPCLPSFRTFFAHVSTVDGQFYVSKFLTRKIASFRELSFMHLKAVSTGIFLVCVQCAGPLQGCDFLSFSKSGRTRLPWLSILIRKHT